MRILNKLVLTFIVFSFTLILTFAVLMRWSIDKGMVDYVNTQDLKAVQPVILELANIYSKHNGWNTIENDHRQFISLINRFLFNESLMGVSKGRKSYLPLPPHIQDQRRREPPPHSRRPPPDHFGAPLLKPILNYALLDINKVLVVGKYVKETDYQLTPIMHNNKVVGYLAVSKRDHLTEGYELDFIDSQTEFLWILVFGVMGLVILVTRPLALHLVTPLKILTQGIHQLTQGNYQQNVIFKRKDEFGDASRDFNQLARTLSKNELDRKRWLENTSHELRTPVAILRGELEAMIDNVRPLSMKNIESLNQEVKHLERLIEDLQMLTNSDIGELTYHKEKMQLNSFLLNEEKKISDFLADEKLNLNINTPPIKLYVYADSTRLSQVIENIVNNSKKYAVTGTHVNISLTKAVENSKNIAYLRIEDDGVGVTEEHLPYLFEHLYRVDTSRNRKLGGSGLGLSISAQIIEAHKGSIVAKKSPLGGLAIIISIPLSD